jgi:DNA-binding transcriptional regulator YhcF (GntR family)
MKSRVFDLIAIDEYSSTPKYLQLANSIVSAIEVGKMKKDDVLPSINELTCEYDISKATVEKGYKYLRSIGVLEAVPGKGYYIKSIEVRQKLKIFLLFNKLSVHKKIIYDAFVAAMGEEATIDFHIYNNDYALFKKLVLNNTEEYAYYVVVPHFLEGGEYAHAVLNSIPKDKLLLLDKKLTGVKGEYAAVYENFEKDIYRALQQANERLSRYHTLKIIFPEYSYYPKEIVNGFCKFCMDYSYGCKVVHSIEAEPISEGEVFINLMEDDLVTLVERILSLQLKVGKQVGIISYNETPLKKIILDGITTISCDFRRMGEMAAQLILDGSKQQQEVPFHLTLRSSL